MNWTLDLLSPLSLGAILAWMCALVVVLLLLRLAAGPPAAIARRRGLLLLRAVVVLLILLLLANPVKVSETPGRTEQADVFYLMDASESMTMDAGSGTRWDEALGVIDGAAATSADQPAADVKYFRFGNRLTAITATTADGDGANQNAAPGALLSGVTPADTDTRLQMALRQISTRFGRSPPASIVLFSDGRARDSEGLSDLARHFADLKVPIHVVPVGNTARGGDVAIVAAVVPETVRRHSRVEIQVFLRSYGFDGRRVQVHLSAVDEDGTPVRSLTAPQPITLHSGFQSHSITFRADKDARNLMIHIPPEPDEISARNNHIESELFIDQTKIRVLYVEGTRQPPQPVRQGNDIVMRGPYSQLQAALMADDDIECVVLSGAFGDLRRLGFDNRLDATRGFPLTMAELAAFDALILSNVSRDMFTDEQLNWIERWVGERGAGLCMVGGPSSFASGGWADDTLARILPVVMDRQSSDWDPGAVVQGKVDTAPHPIWHIVSDAQLNRTIIEQFPIFDGANRGLAVKDALATTLVTAPLQAGAVSAPGDFSLKTLVGITSRQVATDAQQLPVLTIGPYGKGRSMAMATAITEPWARAFLNDWGQGEQRYYAKFWRNVVYWMTEDSTIGRRRLIASHDKQYYQPGDTLSLRAIAYDEGANNTQAYRILAMIEPKSALLDPNDIASPVRWPSGVPREEGFEGPFVLWGEEFELPKLGTSTAGPLGRESGYGIDLKLNDVLPGGAANEGLRIELTAMEGQTQVDSTSIEIQILHDPFEHQNPFPDHELLQDLARASGGRVLRTSDELADVLTGVRASQGPPVVRRSPLWSNWWMWSLLVVLLTVDWLWRRQMGLA